MDKKKLVPYFPSGVSIENNSIYDKTIETSLPINHTAKVMLMEVDGEKDINEIIHNLNKKFKIDEEILFKDIASLFGDLNKNYLLNWKVKTNHFLMDSIMNFLSQYKIGYRERFEIHHDSFWGIFFKILLVVIRKIIVFWVGVLALSTLVYFYTELEFVLSLAYYFSIVYIGLILSFTLHETMHAYIHRKMTSKCPGFIASDVMSVKFIRPIIRPYKKKMIWITIVGPLIPGIIGMLGVILLQIFSVSGVLASTLYVIFIIFAAHLLYLLPFLGDGKSVIKQLMLN